MKRILVATDFSAAADRAVEYGAKLAAALDAAVTILAVYQEIPVPVTDTMSLAVIDAADARELVESGLLRQKDLFKQGKTQAMNTRSVKGPVVASILETAEEENADLLVVGMKSRGKALRRVFGSTVTALARKTTTPLLVVPEEARYLPPSAILLGNDVRPDTDLHVLDTLRELVAVFSSRLYALRVIQKGTKEFIGILHQPNPLGSLEKTWDIKYEYEMGDDVAEHLNDFGGTHNIGMVVMMARPHSLPQRWFVGSHTHEMIFEARIPLLILPERK
ncbi:MAG TPA: universal stress protein [Puia sp.]|uniref:universal stress protein n=1 Tax=Puia sp. TaxID=2045100 RepID=UPI002C4FA7E8|nr:universal stress protein [Puia sp.]HVU94125.1 universal stress protein [Puia sp.]